MAGGALAVALGGREARIYADPSASKPRTVFASGLNAVNALAAAPDGMLIATDGRKPAALINGRLTSSIAVGAGGSCSSTQPSGSVKTVASGLSYAFGVAAKGHAMLVSESWRHRVIALERDGSTTVVLPHLPAYPSRISLAAAGGYWLTAFVARSLLVEFVLREPAYRRRMMAEIAPEYWIVPRLRSGQSFKEPLQGAHIKTMGVVKPVRRRDPTASSSA